MIERKESVKCLCCKTKDNGFTINLNKKEKSLCSNCFLNLYVSMGKFILPKSPESIMKKDNRIKNERF